MERLTTFVDGTWVLSGKAIREGYDKYSVVSRLAAYEDSGLMPKEVAELQAKMERLQKENAHLKKLVANIRQQVEWTNSRKLRCVDSDAIEFITEILDKFDKKEDE